MIILFSDIHLADVSTRSTFNSDAFIDRLNTIVRQAADRGVTDITIVLLGDIFEILKSQLWLDRKLRPWQDCSADHVATVHEILKRIIESNDGFFARLKLLTQEFPSIRFEYIPGNHDGAINTEMGTSARALLQESLPVPEKDGEEFQPLFVDPDHKLIARHGHEWDPANRYGDGTVAWGDAIVIDLVLSLPRLAAKKLKLSEDDPRLEFLYEVDNVRPHTLRVISQWVYGGLQPLKDTDPKVFDAIDQIFRQLVRDLLCLSKEVRFESFTTNRLRRKTIGKFVVPAMKVFGSMNAARWVALETGSDSFEKYVLRDLRALGRNYKYIVCGHTHRPLLIPLEAQSVKDARLYMNTGTWRRVRPVSMGPDKKRNRQAAFSCWEEECIVSIFNDEEQQKLDLPAYNFQQLTRGN
jgi:UDP-2,3-diacylglucosamine pyrophosphatase LpxH